MRKITEKIVKAFYEGNRASADNSAVVLTPMPAGLPMVSMFLHGSEIARRIGPLVAINLQGFPSRTTQDRLRAVVFPLGGSVWQERHVVYASGPETDGKPVEMPTKGWVLVAAGTVLEQLAFVQERELMTTSGR